MLKTIIILSNTKLRSRSVASIWWNVVYTTAVDKISPLEGGKKEIRGNIKFLLLSKGFQFICVVLLLVYF
jgi:hypothetical protein